MYGLCSILLQFFIKSYRVLELEGRGLFQSGLVDEGAVGGSMVHGHQNQLLTPFSFQNILRKLSESFRISSPPRPR